MGGIDRSFFNFRSTNSAPADTTIVAANTRPLADSVSTHDANASDAAAARTNAGDCTANARARTNARDCTANGRPLAANTRAN